MKKVHWTVSYDHRRFFHYILKASKDLKSNNMNIYYSWCNDNFGYSFSEYNMNAKWSPGLGSILYFKRKSDILLFLLTWQDIEI